MSLKLSLKNLLYQKILLATKLEEALSDESKAKALSDHHARRPPRPCGFTVHSAVGCTYSCSYCYLPDMGISFREVHVYGLTGEEVSYALLKNPYFLPTRFGSQIAVGSVGEPFASPEAASKTMEYIASFEKYLGNPVQFSTKAVLDEETAGWLAQRKVPVNPLVTVVTLDKYKELEPGAPPPYERLESMRRMRKKGLRPMLFLRPLIPGVTSEEAEEILEEAKRHGAVGVVIGGLRVTPSILARLEKAGVDTGRIRGMLKGVQLTAGKQVPLPLGDLKREVLEIARSKGLVPFLSACCANNFNAYLHDGKRVPCPGLDYIDGKYCTACPVGCPSLKTEVDPDEVREIIEKFTGVKGVKVEVDDRYIRVTGGKVRLKKHHVYLIETGYRRRLRTSRNV
ncbi:radical SAM protein [Thermofilum pendens]|uniref:Radical SAM domain protein n=1 Tax=Thermofilum pendens (strain DSM 2475 / Hrk 5) TaxID=368408 RepID=A1RY77_THEPD|nr:radical SAM protein [Thermofilum pendens]ABL78157.1 Radical SAM domain protein [Thermofilum pendens Hrk 5]